MFAFQSESKSESAEERRHRRVECAWKLWATMQHKTINAVPPNGENLMGQTQDWFVVCVGVRYTSGWGVREHAPGFF